MQLLALAAGHPAADLYTREKATADLEALRARLSLAEFESLVARGRGLTLDAVRQARADGAAC